MTMEWRAAAVEPGTDPPTAGEWVPVDVPGRPERFAGEEAVAYRAVFEDPRDPADDHAVLVLGGTYAHARVWLNGEQLAEHDAYFEPLGVPLPIQENNELIVECRRPEDRFGGTHDTDLLAPEQCVPGIWWDARIETHPDPYVDALAVEPVLEDGGTAVDVRVTVVTDEPLDERVTVSLRPEGDVRGGGMMNRLHVDTEPGRATVTERIEVRDAALWWPHTIGSQPRYSIRAKLDDAERTVTTGLRTVEYDPDDGLTVNGESIRARGINVLDGGVADVQEVVDAGANVIRAHAHALSPDVYEACDEAGVLVWQDLPLTGPGEFDPERGTDLAERLVSARRRHPSLAAIGVHDDPIPSYADGLGSGAIDRLRYRWRAWRAGYDDEDADGVAAAVTDLPVFPVVGPAGIDPDATTMYPGWEFGSAADVSWLCDRYEAGAVVGEFGAGEADDQSDPRAEQAAIVGRVAETLRLRGSDLFCVFALRDEATEGMGLIDAGGDHKLAYDRLRAAYAPVQAFLTDPTPGESAVVVVNERRRDGAVTVEWDHDGDREQRQVTIGAQQRATLTTLSLSAGDEVTLGAAFGDSVTTNEYEI